MRAVVTGATGFIGRALLQKLERPVVLTRRVERAQMELPGTEACPWDPAQAPPSADAFRNIDAVFHLAGESVAGARWTEQQKARIRDSRVLGTRNLIEGLAKVSARPGVLVCASAVGYYGDRGDEELDEGSPPGEDFLAQVCKEWEGEAARARSLGMRVVPVRIGVVLGKGGGALARMLPIFRLGIGGRLSSGRQWMPWVHIDDLAGIMLKAAEDEALNGPVNAVAPQPATNAEFTRELGRALGRPAMMPVPKFALRLAFGEMSNALLSSQRAIPRRVLEAGYRFRYPELGQALDQIVGPQ